MHFVEETPASRRVDNKRKRVRNEDEPRTKRRRENNFVRTPKTKFTGNVSSDCDEDPSIHWKAKNKKSHKKKVKAKNVNSDNLIDKEEKEFRTAVKKKRRQQKKKAQKTVKHSNKIKQNFEKTCVNGKHKGNLKQGQGSTLKSRKAKAGNKSKGLYFSI